MLLCIFYAISLALIGQIQNACGLLETNPVINTKVGTIRGVRANDGNYSMFLGIPYASVNDTNPFGVSIPQPKFREVFEAYNDSAICPQIEEFNNTIVGTLDCLHINIFVPNTASPKNQLPVLVYVYGGLYMIGFAGRYLYGARFLMKQNIILVTLNYRLGPYGFMCLDTPDVPGNQGLKDQKLALKWIKNNIEAFGGNSSKITLCGSSSGGSSVDFHLMYNHEILFDQVIMQSGTALYPWSMYQPDPTAPLKLSKHLGSTAMNIDEALAFLSTVNPHVLIAATSELDLKFGPCVENVVNKNDEKFIYDYPVNIKEPSLGNVPILLGCNSHEALANIEILPPENFTTLSLFFDDIQQYFNIDSEELVKAIKIIKHFYIGDEKMSVEVKSGISKLNSDFYFNYPVVRTIRKYLDNGFNKIYYYLFAHSGNRNFLKSRFNVTAHGACHADEIGYLFDVSFMDKNITSEDKLIINRMSTLWANFVKYGNPTPQTSKLLPLEWPLVTKDLLNYLHIDTEIKVKRRNFKARMAFWDLFYKLYEKSETGYRENSDQYTCPVTIK